MEQKVDYSYNLPSTTYKHNYNGNILALMEEDPVKSFHSGV